VSKQVVWTAITVSGIFTYARHSYVHGVPKQQSSQPISPRLVLLLALSCGAAVANLYYAQPLLPTLSRAFGVSAGTAGLLITITQAGFVIGLAFLVPVGDLHERRSLISGTLLVTATALVVAAAAPGFGVFASAIAVVGVTSVVAQIIVPMSSSLAAPHERGSVVGKVMSGLLIGILLARTFSGLVASAFGWRTVFAVGAVVMLALAATLRRALPRVPPTTTLSYGGLLRSVLALIRSEPVLRQRMVLAGLAFGCFTALWTSLPFLLSGPPYHYGNGVIGLFGLAGLAGALAASVAGRLADRGYGSQAVTVGIVVMLASWAILAIGRHSAVALIVGIALLDLGVQSVHISSQSALYALHPDARSRLSAAYMLGYFSGGVVLSALSASLYSSDGWSGVCVIGGVASGLALAVWALSSLVFRARAREVGLQASRMIEP
jgi:predicted MFS family arabinose efflux permease